MTLDEAMAALTKCRVSYLNALAGIGKEKARADALEAEVEKLRLLVGPAQQVTASDGPFDLSEFEELSGDTVLSLRIVSGPLAGTEIDTIKFRDLRFSSSLEPKP